MKKSGIILEIDKNKAYIMTNEAGFSAIKSKPGMFIGQQVDLDNEGFKGIDFLRFRYLPGLASIAVLIAVFIFTVFRPSNLYAYMTVDINPSVEFTVNKEIRIINVRDLNKDAKNLLEGTNFRNLTAAQALLILVNKAEQENYFKKGRFVLVSAASNKISAKEPGLLEKSINEVNQKLTIRNIRLQYIRATLEERKIALHQHLSMGRYALLTSTDNTGKSINLDEAKTGSVVNLLEKAGMLETEEPGKQTPGQNNGRVNEEKKDPPTNVKKDGKQDNVRTKDSQNASKESNTVDKTSKSKPEISVNNTNNHAATNLSGQRIIDKKDDTDLNNGSSENVMKGNSLVSGAENLEINDNENPPQTDIDDLENISDDNPAPTGINQENNNGKDGSNPGNAVSNSNNNGAVNNKNDTNTNKTKKK